MVAGPHTVGTACGCGRGRLRCRGRAAFRGALDVDDGTWNRARGYALHQARLIIPYYAETNPGFAALAKRTVEPLNADPDDAVALAEAIEQALTDGAVQLEQVHHGDGIASWAVNRRAVARGHGIRTGLEDTPFLPDGRIASGNGELVTAAVLLMKQSPRTQQRRESIK
jgi:hypothetical protein